jgi:hypothetical protein
MISFSQKLTQLDGSDIVDAGATMTLGKACVAALCATFQDEQNLPGLEKFERYVLASKITDAEKDGQSIELSAAEAEKLRTLVGKAYSPIVAGQAWKILSELAVTLDQKVQPLRSASQRA